MNEIVEQSAEREKRRYKRYPEYQDSGVEWLAEVPAHWEVRQLKRIAKSIRTGTTPPTSESRYYDDGTIPWFGPSSISDQLHVGAPSKHINESAVQAGCARVFEASSTLIVTIGATIGKVAYLASAGSANQQITAVAPRLHHMCSSFFAYQLKCVEPLLRGVAPSTTIPILDQDEIAYLPVVVPPIAEQNAIVALLRCETAKIDALVAKNERLIELLQEKRAAFITHAVTKGLDPTVPMKDSGIEWLGEIPAHWEAIRNKYVARLESGHTPSRQHPEYWVDCTIPWFGLADVWQLRNDDREYVSDTAEMISEIGLANSAARLLPEGTVILSRTASVGFSAVMEVAMATTQDFVNWVCGPRIKPEYLFYVLRSMRQEFRRLTMGSTHQTIYMPDVARFATPIPPIHEQEAVVTFIEEECVKIDGLVAKVREAIDRLREYRTALITAAVTGKIDVRDEVAG